ncbi:hypothetical protein LTR37_009071 [Vermiconidia calcicola]|uniref:Uncharacterized protein n=1 Tax=Vermiconidia calcicola TaxID=1690605 RepID=A0ACC3N917_9PEZI|nr:hypothetical protein LTR37_009071 [Vermiconidia calcicola]
MADQEACTLAEAFSDLTLELPPPILQFQGGTVIISLSEKLEDQLLLHESDLRAASERFRLRFNNERFSGGRKIIDPVTEKEVKVWKYHLICTDDTMCLTDEGEKVSSQHDQPYYLRSFQYSALAHGYRRACTLGGLHYQRYQIMRAHKVTEHKMLFALLYDQHLKIDTGEPPETLHMLTEITALAEFYMLLPSIAGRTTSLLEEAPGLWKDIAEYPAFYLSLSTKLHAGGIFAEALRHYVGRCAIGVHGRPRMSLDYVDAGLALVILRKQHELESRMNRLTTELRELSLNWYQASAWKTRRLRGAKVRTTWLYDGFGKKSLQEMGRWVAASIYRLFVPHAMTLCEPAKTLRTSTSSEKNAARKFATIFQLYRQSGRQGPNPAAMIAGQLKALLRNARKCIDYWFPAIDDYRNSTDSEEWSHAKYDSGLCYFTFLAVDDSDTPWHEKDAFEDFKCDNDLEQAPDDWLELVGLGK